MLYQKKHEILDGMLLKPTASTSERKLRYSPVSCAISLLCADFIAILSAILIAGLYRDILPEGLHLHRARRAAGSARGRNPVRGDHRIPGRQRPLQRADTVLDRNETDLLRQPLRSGDAGRARTRQRRPAHPPGGPDHAGAVFRSARRSQTGWPRTHSLGPAPGSCRLSSSAADPAPRRQRRRWHPTIRLVTKSSDAWTLRQSCRPPQDPALRPLLDLYHASRLLLALDGDPDLQCRAIALRLAGAGTVRHRAAAPRPARLRLGSDTPVQPGCRPAVHSSTGWSNGCR